MNIQAFEQKPDPASPPPSVSLEGKGKLKWQSGSLPVDVRLFMVPGRTTTVTCKAPILPGITFQNAKGKGDGFLAFSYAIEGEADGRSFHCSELIGANETSTSAAGAAPVWQGVFLQNQPLCLGQMADDSTPVLKASFPLMTYCGPGLKFRIDGWDYHVRTSNSQDKLRKQARIWKAPLETALLDVETNTPVPLRELLEQVDVFLWMLSLSQGDRIGYHRYCVRDEANKDSEIWNSWHIVDNPVLCAEMRNCQDFLPTAVSTYLKKSPEHRNLLQLAIGYHLQAKKRKPIKNGFINEAIAWEMLVSTLVGEQPLPPAAADLKTRISAIYKHWRKDYPKSDPNGLYGKRLSSCLEWTPLGEGIRDLLASLGIVDGAPVDSLLLRKFRDSIVHTGHLPKGHAPDENTFRILQGLLRMGDLIFFKLLCQTQEC